MNIKKDSIEESESQSSSASYAGAGGGTIIAVLANQLPDTNIAKPILQYTAPSITVLISFLWVLLRNHYRDKEVDTLFKKARERLIKRNELPQRKAMGFPMNLGIAL
ncbi:hypothetical protein [Pleurocapsa sp. PCC 7319]|uniref:hypothetical protein n=1 Tax=Pleurocapsa sp. PCC 7319 TaxID=118161 RepID=UPI001181C64F|nr:hypothetical protein [Pleurocapsa sp. PCC 7319]